MPETPPKVKFVKQLMLIEKCDEKPMLASSYHQLIHVQIK